MTKTDKLISILKKTNKTIAVSLALVPLMVVFYIGFKFKNVLYSKVFGSEIAMYTEEIKLISGVILIIVGVIYWIKTWQYYRDDEKLSGFLKGHGGYLLLPYFPVIGFFLILNYFKVFSP